VEDGSSLAADTGLTAKAVRRAIAQAGDEVVKSSISDKTGQELFSTRRHLVMKALEYREYEWRTVAGIAADTGLGSKVVKEVIAEAGGKIVRRRTRDSGGNELFRKA
jgi:hypothetical protein